MEQKMGVFSFVSQLVHLLQDLKRVCAFLD